MHIANLDHHCMCECGKCFKLFVVKGDPYDSHPLTELLHAHLAISPECKAWYDALPRMEDLKGINITDGMDSVEYVRRLRGTWDDDEEIAGDACSIPARSTEGGNV